MTARPTEELEAALAGGEMESRLAALRALCKTAPRRSRRGTNLHVHTNESFSVFRSPCEAVWQAVREGVAVLGINDHYTVAGHDEFRRACAIAGIPATFSIEAVAMDRDAEASGLRTNDPDNPGRTYLCGKGVTRIPPESSTALHHLHRMRRALGSRHREMTEKVRALFLERIAADGPTWEDVAALAPRGNITERHIAKAALLRLGEIAGPKRPALLALVRRLCRDDPPADADAALQNFLRSRLLKAGGPCFVEESPDAFLSIEDLRDLFLEFGSIPTYPVLADPVTEGERDLDALMDRLEAMHILALEVIPHRNTRERLGAVLRAARARHWPVFNGSEHNTPERRPLLDPLSLDPEFLPWFEDSAAVLLGHQYAVEHGQPGFVNEKGVPLIRDARRRFEHFRDAGRVAWEAVGSSRTPDG